MWALKDRMPHFLMVLIVGPFNKWQMPECPPPGFKWFSGVGSRELR